jgi:uncharacterized membrane protein
VLPEIMKKFNKGLIKSIPIIMTIKVLYVGGWGVKNDSYTMTPFETERKIFEIRDFSNRAHDALRENTDIELTTMTSWEAYANFPRELEKLQEYNVMVNQTTEADVYLLYPEFYFRDLWDTEKIIVLPNRLEIIRKFVEDGGGFLQVGGWFGLGAGKFARAQWHNTPVEKVHAVEFLEVDDRVEAPEGAYVSVIKEDHPIMKGIPWDECPPFLGYNRVKRKKEGELLANIEAREQGFIDPFIAVREYGKGRSMAVMSAIHPHWGANFMKWKYYKQFLWQTINWLAHKL